MLKLFLIYIYSDRVINKIFKLLLIYKYIEYNTKD